MLNVECLYFTNSTYPRLETPVFRHYITQVFKKRPRAAQRSEPVPSKREPDYWRGRLFKNTFTYKGRRMEVSGWTAQNFFAEFQRPDPGGSGGMPDLSRHRHQRLARRWPAR